MDPLSVYGISSAASAVAGSPITSLLTSWFGNWLIKRRLRKRSGGLLLMKGVSTLCEKLTTSTHLYLDVDKLYQQLTAPRSAEDLVKVEQHHNPVDDYLAYPIIKNHIANISSVFKGKIILVSNSLQLLHAMPVYHTSIIFGAFSKDMEANIGSIIYANPAQHQDAVVQKFRAIQDLPKDQVLLVSSLNELYDKVSDHYGSKRIAI